MSDVEVLSSVPPTIMERLITWAFNGFVAIILFVWHEDRKDTKTKQVAQDIRIKELEQALSAHREHSAEKFMTRAEFKEEAQEMKILLHRINDKLDLKVDKSEIQTLNR